MKYIRTFTFLFVFVSTLSQAKSIQASFEVYHAQKAYIDIARAKAHKLNAQGFVCYVKKTTREVSVLCNDVNTTEALNTATEKFKKAGIAFTVKNAEGKIIEKGTKKSNYFYYGYTAYDNKDYIKAEKIFGYYYKKEKSYEHAYAYALALDKNKKNKAVLDVLKGYREYNKAKKLYDANLLNYLNPTLDKGNFKQAHEILDKYASKDETLLELVNNKEEQYSVDKKALDKRNTLFLKEKEHIKRQTTYQQAPKLAVTKGENSYIDDMYFEIKKDIQERRYSQAEYTINYAKSIYPKDVNLLILELQLYKKQFQYLKAQDVALELVQAGKDSVEVEYVLAVNDFQNNNYGSCSSRLKNLKYNASEQEELFNQCQAYLYVQNNDMKRAINSINKVSNNHKKAIFYIDLGELYRHANIKKTLYFLHEAQKYQQSIGRDSMYLNIATVKIPEKTRTDDRDIYRYYKNRNFESCNSLSRIMSESGEKRDVMNMRGWCAYFVGEYNEAKNLFSKVNQHFGESNKDIYAYALSAYQARDDRRAYTALGRIKNMKSNEEMLAVALLYMDLGDDNTAKKILQRY